MSGTFCIDRIAFTPLTAFHFIWCGDLQNFNFDTLKIAKKTCTVRTRAFNADTLNRSERSHPGQHLSVPLISPDTGECRQAQIFVAVLGASNYTFAEATYTQSLPDWLLSHVRMLEFFGGVPEILVPDHRPGTAGYRCCHGPVSRTVCK